MAASGRRLAVPVLVCGFLAASLEAVAMTATLRSAGWSLSALARVSSRTALGAEARALDPGFHTVANGAYDGQFYWGVAVDPLATGSVHRAFDKPSYRYGHPLYGWLAWLLSAGRARAVPAALALIGLAALFAAAAFASALGRGRGRSGWEGLFVALNAGLIVAASHDLAEPLAAALLLGAVLAYVHERRGLAWICLALLPLSKEPLLAASLAFVAWELVQHRPRRAAMFATAVIPSLLWWTYARVHLGAWFTTGTTALGRPFAGWWHSLFADAGLRETWTAVAILLFLLVLLTAATARALRHRGPVEFLYLALAVVVACLAPNATRVFTTALRNTALLVVLLPFVIAAPQLLPRTFGRTRSPASAPRHA